jgi:hypothetical protein
MNKIYMFTISIYERFAIVCAESEEKAREILVKNRNKEYDFDTFPDWQESECKELNPGEISAGVIAVSQYVDQYPDSRDFD